MSLRSVIPAPTAFLVVLGVAPLAGQAPVFVEQLGLLDDTDISAPPFSSGVPMAVADMNGDLRDDIVRLHDLKELNIEYQQDPGGPFGHLDLGVIPSIWNQTWGWSICVADIDHNGLNDMVIGELYSGHDCYLANSTGTGYSVSDIPTRVQVVQDTILADLDNDGWLDIFACDDVDDLHKYRNTGTGSFVLDDSLIPTLLTAAGSDDNAGNYAIMQTDFDRDGDLDYYLSKCEITNTDPASLGRINRLFENDGSGNYTDVPGAMGLADGAQTWCADFGDIDNDGDLDCFALNHQFAAGTTNGPSEPSKLYLNDGSGSFSDSTAAVGLAGEVDFLGMQALFRDFNNDGWVDLLVSSMDLSPATYGYFQNDGDGTFTRLTGVFKQADGTSNVTRIYSFAAGDLNHDGFLDLYASRGEDINGVTDEPDLLLFNQGNSNGFLTLTLAGNPSNRNGIGARIEAHGPWGVQVREVRGGDGYGIMNSLNTHFGISGEPQVDQLVVRWPSGTVDTIDDVPGSRFGTVHEGAGIVTFDFADWIADFYPGGGADAEPDADPDGDGTGSAVEQLLGSNPSRPDAGSPADVSVIEEDGQHYAVFEVDRVPTRDVVPGVEFRPGEGVWDVDPGMEVLEDSPFRYVVRLPVDLASTPVLFARLTAGVGP